MYNRLRSVEPIQCVRSRCNRLHIRASAGKSATVDSAFKVSRVLVAWFEETYVDSEHVLVGLFDDPAHLHYHSKPLMM